LIQIDAVLDKAGLLKSCTVKGHAGFTGGFWHKRTGKAGADIVCAAVSVLVRTALRLFSGKKGIEVRGAAPERGLLWMELDYTAEGRDFLSTAGEFLLEGLKGVSEDYPKNCKMTIHSSEE
jgi:uncharacterized protein YsxB (DUF464 family)